MIVHFSDDYVAAADGFDTVRKAGAVAASLTDDPIPDVEIRAPRPATRHELVRVHEPTYVDAVLTGHPRELAASAGLGWTPTFATSVLASAGGCRDAATAAWRDGVSGSLSSGLHHARRDTGNGYCTFNGVALAALEFLDLGARRVLIVDLDAHCGGGTADILGDDPRVSQIDVATNDFDDYIPPPEWSLQTVRRPEDYLHAVERSLASSTATATDSDAVVYNAGMDPHELCGIGGLDGITDEILRRREQLVFGWAAERDVPVAFVLAGGYTSRAMDSDRLTQLHRFTIEAARMRGASA